MSRLSNRQHQRGIKTRWEQSQAEYRRKHKTYGDRLVEALNKLTDEQRAEVDALPVEGRFAWLCNLVPPEENP